MHQSVGGHHCMDSQLVVMVLVVALVVVALVVVKSHRYRSPGTSSLPSDRQLACMEPHTCMGVLLVWYMVSGISALDTSPHMEECGE